MPRVEQHTHVRAQLQRADATAPLTWPVSMRSQDEEIALRLLADHLPKILPAASPTTVARLRQQHKMVLEQEAAVARQQQELAQRQAHIKVRSRDLRRWAWVQRTGGWHTCSMLGPANAQHDCAQPVDWLPMLRATSAVLIVLLSANPIWSRCWKTRWRSASTAHRPARPEAARMRAAMAARTAPRRAAARRTRTQQRPRSRTAARAL